MLCLHNLRLVCISVCIPVCIPASAPVHSPSVRALPASRLPAALPCAWCPPGAGSLALAWLGLLPASILPAMRCMPADCVMVCGSSAGIANRSINRMQILRASNVVLKTRKDDTENHLYRPENVFAYNRYGRGGEAVGLSARPPRLYYSTTDTRKQDANMCNNMQQHAKGQL